MYSLFRPHDAAPHTLSAPLDTLVPLSLATATFGVG